MGYRFAICISAVLVQITSSQSIGFNNRVTSTGQNLPNAKSGFNLGSPGCSVGGSFAVTSTSPVSPTGVSVVADNLAIEGPLSVGGSLPFLGTVDVEGTLQNSGTGSVNYSCGGESVKINNERGGNPGSGSFGVRGAGFGLRR